jgi:hypothetical protein
VLPSVCIKEAAAGKRGPRHGGWECWSLLDAVDKRGGEGKDLHSSRAAAREEKSLVCFSSSSYFFFSGREQITEYGCRVSSCNPGG